MTTAPEPVDDIIEEFAFLDDWEERYRHVIALGGALPALREEERTEANKVKGCVSQVWLVTETTEDAPGKLRFRADSDAHIVRGLAALLIRLYAGRTPEEALSLDARSVFDRIDLAEHLSPQRANGLNAMIARIHAEAARLRSS